MPSPAAGASPSLDRGDTAGPHSSRPFLTVLRGQPTDEELAALTAVVAALAQSGGPRRRPTPVGAWASRADLVRTPLSPGPGGWRASGRFS
ncbi:acyl-CoA carboxylase subunit epsilon [Modestobacter sp. I12A-02628]|uniref:Acyl-CoA carboxylase subunit epsilon n=1 Tax=Goekera deserti TaxID=2497753 RepID=A0A7K3W8B1_9ACTN|nr:acyl-CoA carboxylase subunit epsilon [Goekera deserti]NDI49489.1 acyl-CoA carboxylase subunit epsilon [Goekera deserti]NEL52637.1 acyl-CoA carboxylase subunit epsilon [Goekera deserti]